MAENKKEVVWRAAEYERGNKDAGWYWIAGGISAVLTTIAIWQKNFFFALFIVLAGTMIIVFNRQRPRVLEFKVNEEGIGINGNFYKYEQFESFSAHSRPGKLNEIAFKKKAVVNPYLKIPIDSKSAAKAKEILLERLPEIEHNESLIEIISDRLGF